MPAPRPGSAALHRKPHYLVTQDAKPLSSVYLGKRASEIASIRRASNSVGGVATPVESVAVHAMRPQSAPPVGQPRVIEGIDADSSRVAMES